MLPSGKAPPTEPSSVRPLSVAGFGFGFGLRFRVVFGLSDEPLVD